jgi:DNA-binding LytR/AlgR family response regulator
MEPFLSRLPKGAFYRCHQSLAVNLDRVVSITCEYIELEGGIRLAACRAALQRTKRAWERYLDKS